MNGRNLINLLRCSRTFLFYRRPLHLITSKELHIQTSTLFTQIHFHKLSSVTSTTNFSSKPQAITSDTSSKQLLIDTSDPLFEKLQQELTGTGFINIESLTKTIQALSLNLSEIECNFLLDCCASIRPSEKFSTKLEIFYKIWNAINKNGKPTKDHYLKAAKVLKDKNVSKYLSH